MGFAIRLIQHSHFLPVSPGPFRIQSSLLVCGIVPYPMTFYPFLFCIEGAGGDVRLLAVCRVLYFFFGRQELTSVNFFSYCSATTEEWPGDVRDKIKVLSEDLRRPNLAVPNLSVMLTPAEVQVTPMKMSC